MALQYVTLILDGFDGGGTALGQGSATFVPSVQLTDPTDQEWIPPAPVQAHFRAGLAAPQVSLLATDNGNVTPAGWGWTVSFLNVPGSPASFSFFLPFANGSTQRLSALQPVQSVTAMQAYMPLSGGAFTGAVDPSVVTLTDAASITINAAMGNDYRVTIAGNRTLANPINGTDGQMISVLVTQGAGGGFTLSYGSAFNFGNAGSSALSNTAGKTDWLGFKYDAAKSQWLGVPAALGY